MHDVDGLRTRASAFTAKDTMDRLEALVRARGMTVFARVDHAAGAAEAGLAPTCARGRSRRRAAS